MILIDEAYHHFVSATSSYRSFLDYPLDDPRVIVARTFSKIYGLAGLRIGYCVSSREVASRLSALRLPNGVTIVSVKAAIAALEDTTYVRMAAKRNADDRQEFMNQVNARMLRAIDSHANFGASGISCPPATRRCKADEPESQTRSRDEKVRRTRSPQRSGFTADSITPVYSNPTTFWRSIP